MNAKHLLLRKTDVFKNCRKSKFLGKKIWRNALALKSKKVQGIFGKRLFWHYCLQLSFVYEHVSQISFNLIRLWEKRLLSEFRKKWGWFQGHTLDFFISNLGFCRARVARFWDQNSYWSCLIGCLNYSCETGSTFKKRKKVKKEVSLLV